MKNRYSWLALGLVFLLCLGGALTRCAGTRTNVDGASLSGTSSVPYNITNNFAEDSSTEFLAQWHNEDAIAEQKLQIAVENEAEDFTGARTIIVTGENFVSTNTEHTFASPAAGDYPSRNVFRAHITELTPDTQYMYRMGDTGAWSDTFYHRTSGGGNITDFSFTVVADPQAFPYAGHRDMRNTLLAANEYDPDNRFFIMCGDLVEQIGLNPQEIVNYTNIANQVNKRTPIAATQGNHDSYYATENNIGNPDFTIAENHQYRFNEGRVFNAFVTFPRNGHQHNTPENTRIRSHSYYFYYNNVLVIMLNTMFSSSDSAWGHEDHTDWLIDVLEHDRENNLSQYIIIGTHMGPFSSREVDRWISRPHARATWGRIASDYDVDIFFSGHDHMYTRSAPIKVAERYAHDAMYNAGDFNAVPNGTIYSIASSTGPKFYAINAGQQPRVSQIYSQYLTTTISEQQPGMFINIKVTSEKLSVTAVRSDPAGTIVDSYEVPAKR